VSNLALKIDVDTFRGTREGVPRLVEILQRHGAGATFLFSLGPDHTGRAIKRALRPGFMQKVGRTSVLSHYGVRTLLYGTLLPGPDIGRRCAPLLRDVRDAGFEYCSDGRGTHPHLPVWNGELIRCPQLPTTLPTLDELIGLDGATEANVAERLLALTAADPRDHVFTLHAELEGMKLAPVLERLLEGWKVQGYALVALRTLVAEHSSGLPLHNVVDSPVPGRSGTLACQGPAFTDDAFGRI
jgi:peptidoglycan/xylan/chitin deacetylase (PgdA/CDA1 family)